jgi:hypothetical protein
MELLDKVPPRCEIGDIEEDRIITIPNCEIITESSGIWCRILPPV